MGGGGRGGRLRQARSKLHSRSSSLFDLLKSEIKSTKIISPTGAPWLVSLTFGLLAACFGVVTGHGISQGLNPPKR